MKIYEKEEIDLIASQLSQITLAIDNFATWLEGHDDKSIAFRKMMLVQNITDDALITIKKTLRIP